MTHKHAMDLFGWVCLVGGVLAALYICWLWCVDTVEQESLVDSDHE